MSKPTYLDRVSNAWQELQEAVANDDGSPEAREILEDCRTVFARVRGSGTEAEQREWRARGPR